jgi:hypothetical protein
MVYCPKCGERLKDGDAFCRYCGAAITRKPGDSEKASAEAQKRKDSAAQAEPAPILRVEEPGEPIQEPLKTGVRKSFCRNCGKELIGTPEICMNCGARPLVGSSFCHACGAATNPLAEICIKCGVRLAKAEAAAVGRSWMATTGGILSIVTGVIIGFVALFVFILGAALGTEGAAGAIVGLVLIAFAIVEIVGGVFAIRRRRWGLALAGAICAVFSSLILGILAVVFIVMSKQEFE